MPKKDRGGIPTPDVIDPPESMSVTLCIPKNVDHMKAFFGALWQLTMWNNWQPDAAHTGKELAAVWYRYWLSWDRTMDNFPDCEDGMATCCIEPTVEHRINPETGRPEVRYNGGDWVGDPTDPENGVLRQPPIVGDGLPSTKCDAASNALQHWTDIVSATSSNIATASGLYTFVVGIVTVLLEIFIIVVTGGVASPLALTIAGMIWGAGSAAFAAGQAAFDEYWSSDALDTVLCALYCNIGEDGQFTEDQYNSFMTDIRFELPSSPARDFLLSAITVGGAAGLSNMASYGGSADSDCGECGCDECACPFDEYVAGGVGYVSCDGNTVTVNSHPDGGLHSVYMVYGGGGTYNADMCAVVLGATVDSGSIDAGSGGYNECHTGTVHFGPFLSACGSQHFWVSTVPFTLTITYGECDCA